MYCPVLICIAQQLYISDSFRRAGSIYGYVYSRDFQFLFKIFDDIFHEFKFVIEIIPFTAGSRIQGFIMGGKCSTGGDHACSYIEL